MGTSAPAPQRLLGAMRELVAQSERLARAEARVVASRVTDAAQASARRLALAVATGVLVTLSMGFLLVAAYDALSAVVPAWQAALIVAGVALLIAALCAWGASASPTVSAALLSPERGDEVR